MRSCTRASLAVWAPLIAAAAGCGEPAPELPQASEAHAAVRPLVEEVRRAADQLGQSWDVRWLEPLKAKALELRSRLAQSGGTAQTRREALRRLDDLLAAIRAAEAVERAKRSVEGLPERSDPAVRAAREELERAWSRLRGFVGEDAQRPFP